MPSCAGAPRPRRLLVGGRHLGRRRRSAAATFTLAIDGRPLDSWPQPPGFFVRAVRGAGRRPRRRRPVRRPDHRLDVGRRTPRRSPTAIEQFDLQSPGITMWAFGRGFHEPELDNQRGARLAMDERRGAARDSPDGRRRDAGARGRVAADVLRRRRRRSRCGAARRELGTVPLSGDFVVRLGVRAARARRPARARCASRPRRRSRRPSAARSADRRRLGLRLFTVARRARPAGPLRLRKFRRKRTGFR